MTKIAIVGGGMGGLAAAFDLVANQPGAHEIAVYERDWRLGGKGASGRNLDPNLGMRIEEHGLHVLMGFYENVFEILHRCYRDLRASGKLPPASGVWWNGVLHGLDEIFFSEPPVQNGVPDRWLHWHVPFPTNAEMIGGPAQELPSVRQLIVGAFKRFFTYAIERLEADLDLADDLFKINIRAVDHLYGRTSTETKRSGLVEVIRRILKKGHDSVDLSDERNHQWFVALYFTGLNLIGILTDVLPNESDFRDELDKLDYKEWVAQYNILGLDDRYHRESAPVNAVYDLVFSRGPGYGFAAGSALYDTLLMLFHYKGHIFYKMAGGMGDVIFAPLYLWLQERGVTFHFFHDLTSIEVSADQTKVEKLVFDVTHDGPFDPLVHVACFDDEGDPITLPCWTAAPTVQPSPPKSRVVTRFDAVVLAIPVGAIREKTKAGVPRCEALYVDPKFRAMAEGMVTRGTRAVQLWFDTDLGGLGWKVLPSSPALGPVLGSYEPELKLNSWADMSQVLPRETWKEKGPRNIAYLCDVFDPPPPGSPSPDRIVHDEGIRWLTEAAGGLWGALAPIDWNVLHDPNGGVGPARFEAQYWRANTSGTEQYVTGAPGTTALRLDPHGTQFSNLFLAGDWVKTPVNAGCVEGAAMGGRIAARRLIDHEADLTKVADALARLARVQAVGTYIERDGDLPLLQPVVMNDVTMHGYIFTADGDRLNETLRAAFEPLGISCRALLPIVVATSVLAKEIRSEIVPEAGYMTEAELGFWIPVRMKWDGGSSVGFYLPYLFVDNVAAMLAGRDIYGFNKIMGRFHYGEGNDIDPTVVEAQVLHTYGRNSKVDWRPVAELSTKVAVEKSTLWSRVDDILDAVGGEIVEDYLEKKLKEAFPIPSFPLFFLKQLRAASDGANVDFQQPVKARVSVDTDSFSAGWLPDVDDGVRLTLTAHKTLDIASTLGLDAVSAPKLGFWARFNATVKHGVSFGEDDE